MQKNPLRKISAFSALCVEANPLLRRQKLFAQLATGLEAPATLSDHEPTRPAKKLFIYERSSIKEDMHIRLLVLFPVCALVSCTSAAKKAELDRQNIFFAEFYYEQGFPARSLAHAKKIKPNSPNYAEAQDWIERATSEDDESEYIE